MGLSEKGFGRMGFALTLGVEVQLTDLLRLFCHFSLGFRNRPFQKEVEIVESFLVVSWFLLLISDARHAILKVLKELFVRWISEETAWYLRCLVQGERRESRACPQQCFLGAFFQGCLKYHCLRKGATVSELSMCFWEVICIRWVCA